MNDEAPGTEASEGNEESAEEQELRERLEEEIRNVRIEDLVIQSAASLLNLAARRIAKEDERDLEQARVGIDAASALVAYAPEEAKAQLERAVSELKLLYATEADGGSGASSEGAESPQPPGESKSDEGGKSGLWTPGG